MENYSKRLLSLVMVVLMVVSMVPTTVFAADTEGIGAITETAATVEVYREISAASDSSITVDLRYFEKIDVDINESGSPLENAVTALRNAGVTGGALIRISEGTLTVTNRQDITMSNVIIAGAGQNSTVITGDSTVYNANASANKNVSSEQKALVGLSGENIKLMDVTVDAGSCGYTYNYFNVADVKTIRINSGTVYLENVTIKGENTRSNLMVGTTSTTATVSAVNVTVADPSSYFYGATETADGSTLTQVNSVLGGAVVGNADLGEGYYKLSSNGVTAYTTIPYAIDLYNSGVPAEVLTEISTDENIAEGTTVAQAMTADIVSGKLLYGKTEEEMLTLAAEFRAALAALSEDTGADVSDCIAQLDNYLAPAASGTFNGGMVNMENPERTFLTLDSSNVYAKLSFVIKVYDAEGNLLATTSLIDHGDILGKKFDTLSTMVGINCTDSYWDTKWEEGKLAAEYVPAYGVLYIDGEEMNSADIRMISTSGEQAVNWADVPGVASAGLNGSGTASDPYKISNKDELFLFAKLVNDGTYQNVHAVLTADIDLEQDDWTSIGTNANPFTGVFDGQGYTIKNLWCAEGENGLFGYTSTGNRADNTGLRATITNVTLDGACVNDSAQKHNGAAAVVGCAGMNTTVTNVTVTGTILITGRRAGVIVGYNYSGLVADNCHVDGGNKEESSITAVYWAAGGICGFGGGVDSYNEVTNCSVKNITVDATNYYGAAAVAGNVYGKIENVSAENVDVKAASEPESNGILSAGDPVTGESFAVNVILTVDGAATDGWGDLPVKVTYPVNNPVYPEGRVEYYTDILKAVPYTTNCPRLEGATVTLLADIAAPGLRLMENDLTLDLNGHTYTITDGTGSQGTNTSGFQIRPEVTTVATIKNGTIEVAEGAPVVWMFNVYATDFVVEDVTVDCTNMAYSYGESCYVHVSRSGDNTQFTGTTKIENFNSEVAGDAIRVGGNMTMAETVVPGGAFLLDAGASLTAPANLDVTTVDGYKVVYENGVYSTAEVEYVAQIGETKYTDLYEALAAANNGDTITILADGTYKLPSFSKELTIRADEGVAAQIDMSSAVTLSGAKVTFENLTFNYGNSSTYKGLQHVDTVIYNNCTVNGQMFLYGASETFNSCTFNQDVSNYNVWTYGAKKVAFNECTFNCAGKSVLVYNEGACATELTVTKSTFNASQAVEGKAAIEIDTTLMPEGTEVVISNSTATGFDAGSVSGNTLWNDKKDQTDLTVTVDGVKVWPVSADMTYSAYGFAASGEGEKYRENFMIDLYDINAAETLVVELYAGEMLIATTALRQTDRDDDTVQIARPITGTMTVNVVVAGRLAGSWDTQWHVAPSVAHIPDTAKIYADGKLVDTYADAFTAEGAAAYAALPGVAKAASVTNAEGTVYYATVQAAIDAAGESETVKLAADVTLTAENAAYDYNGAGTKVGQLFVAADKNIVLDLNGYTLQNSQECSTEVRYDVLVNAGTLKLTDSVGGGKLVSNNNPAGAGGFAVVNFGTMTIENTTIDGNNGSYAVVTQNNNSEAKLTVTNATISGRGAIQAYNAAETVINSGSFSIDVETSNLRDHVIYAYNSAVTVNGGTFDGTASTCKSGSSAVYADGTSTITVNGGSYTAQEGSLTASGTSNIAVTAGTFNTVLKDRTAAAVITLTGGTYVEDVTDYCAPGYEAVTEDTTWWTVQANENIVAWNMQTGAEYETVSAALLAAKNGETVQLLADADESETVLTVLNGITLDINGHTLSAYYVMTATVGSYVTDSTNGDGLLKVAKDNLVMADNSQAMVWKNGESGYRFASVTFGTQVKVTGEGSARFNFYVKELEGIVLAELANGMDDNDGLSIQVKMTYTNSMGAPSELYFNFPMEEVQKYAANLPGYLYMGIGGLDAVTDVTFSAVVKCGNLLIESAPVPYEG